MNGRHPEAVRLVLTNCTDGVREAEFNAWYDRTHLPDIVSSGLATRFADADPESGNAKYLALDELTGIDLERINQGFADELRRLQTRGRIFPALQIGRRSMWRRIGGRFAAKPQALTAGLFMIESNCTDPGRDTEFNAWYDRTHIPDLLGTNLFHTAHRFRGMTDRRRGSTWQSMKLEAILSKPSRSSSTITGPSSKPLAG
jgi:hypothetical protein